MTSPSDGPHWQSRPIAMGRTGCASTPHPLASEAAITVMRNGGNAVDAAVTAAAVCAVVQPFTSGIGGLGWASVYDRMSGAVEVLEFHGRIPAGTRSDLFSPGPDGTIDWMALEEQGRGLCGSLVPGLLAGWDELLRAKGTLSLADAIAPAIRLARDGFPVSTLLHESIVETMPRMRRWPGSQGIFLRNGAAYRPGEVLVQADLAATLERIATSGIGVFYDGPVGRRLVRFYQENGGTLSEADLASYHPRWHAPLVGSFRGHTIKAAPAPLGDLSFLQGLALHERCPRFAGPFDADYVHASLESAKLVREDRARYLGDTGASPESFEHLLGPGYLDARASLIGPAARQPAPQSPGPPHTITLAVVDGAGNAVHLMQTVGLLFGTGAVADGTGIVTNGSLYFADADPCAPNGIVPGRRVEQNPVVMMVFDPSGRLFLVAGSPGGKTRVETVRQMLVNIVDFGMNVQQAVDAPRFLSAPDNRTAELEQELDRMAPALKHELERRGHRVVVAPRRFGTGQAIMVDPATGTRMGGADWRAESVALAY